MNSKNQWRGEPLPRGRHQLAADAVRASQRERLERAIVECVAAHGYEATTVPAVVRTARVSTNAFYEFFTDKADCFLAACNGAAGEMLSELAAMTAEPSWRAATREGMRVYLRWWQDRPSFARAYFVSLPAVGERALVQREQAYVLFRQMFADLARRARAEQPELPTLPRLVPRILVAAITELVAEEIRRGRVDELTELSDELADLAICLLSSS